MQEINSAVQVILDTIEDGFFEVDLAGNMRLCNRALADIIGYPIPELIGRNYVEYMSAETADLVFKVFNSVFRTRCPIKGFEWQLIRRDGSRLWVETSVSPVIAPDGRVLGFRGVLRDITSRKRMEETLAYQLELEKLVARTGQILLMSDESNLDSAIDLALARLGEFVKADRSYLFLYSQDMKTMSNTHEWCAPGITPEKDNLQNLPVAGFSWWANQLFTKPYLYIPSVPDLPLEAAAEKEILQMQDIQSLLVVPVPGQDNKMLGFLGFDAVKETKEWPEEAVRLLSIAAQFIGHAIQQCRSTRLLQESSRFLEDIVNFFPDPFFAIDAEGRITVWNQAMEELTGYGANEVIGRSNFECAIPFYGYRRPLLAHAAISRTNGDLALYDTLTVEGETLTVETEVPLLPGRIIWAKAKPIRDGKGRVKGAIQSMRDITYRVTIERHLKQALSELEAVLEALPDLYLRLSGDGTVLDVRPGYDSPRDILLDNAPEAGKTLREVFVAPFARQLEEALFAMAEERHARVLHLKFANSEERHFQVHLVPLFHNEAVAVIQDITDQYRYTKYLQEISLYDRLTKVYNRNAFQQELERLNGCQDDFPVGIMVCDVNGLKLVNDVLGHLAGDRLLEMFASVLKQCFADKGKVFRTGGDEFVVLFSHHDRRDIRSRLYELETAVAAYNGANPDLSLSISVGTAISTKPDTLIKALEKADNEMYQAKLRQPKGMHPYLKQTLMYALAERDFLAQGHGDRLCEAMLLLAKAAGVPSDRMDDLRLLAYFHDLGKLRIPQHILAKPGPLTLEERREVAKHCSIGHRIALSAPELAPIAEWILHHHERWDGSGYPLGLKETEIPLESRILAIADAYDAITNHRPYRKARSQEEAIAELRSCAGTQFDPDLVELFILAVLPAINVTSKEPG